MPEIEPYPIIKLDEAWVGADEPLGTKRKGWFLLPDTGERWLFKFSRVNQEYRPVKPGPKRSRPR
jgi:hypothetical protein